MFLCGCRTNIIISLEVFYCKLKHFQPPAEQVVYLFGYILILYIQVFFLPNGALTQQQKSRLHPLRMNSPTLIWHLLSLHSFLYNFLCPFVHYVPPFSASKKAGCKTMYFTFHLIKLFYLILFCNNESK